MSEIKLLPSNISNKIAAGEVVERPLNVVKELVENSIDAGADNILIEIEDGGKALIKVTDNGKGILPDDLKNTVKRFATSKITNIDDVYSIKTFGFRGEALAAISSVSDFTLKSKRKGFNGCELNVKFGLPSDVKPSSIPFGTVVIVKNLFENIPARYKFLKSSSAEYKEIIKFIRSFAVLTNDISICLISDGKKVFEVYKYQNMKDKFVEYVKEEDVIYFENKYNDIFIQCCAGLPNVQRYRKDYIITGINGRVVKDNSIVYTIIQAYHRLIPDGKFPVAAINITINPKNLDVNIHPSKTYVKIYNSRDINSFIYDSLSNTLNSVKLTETAFPDFSKESSEIKSAVGRKINQEAKLSFDITKTFETESSFEPYTDYIPSNKMEVDDDFKIIGQLFETVIICEFENEVFFIDQHIAHERILFEKYKKYGLTDIATIVLTEPVLIDLNEEDMDILFKNENTIKSFGFEFERFGNNTIKITSIPTALINKDIAMELQLIANELCVSKSKKNMDYTIVTMACKTAIKAGERLTHFEMKKLVSDLFDTENPYTCPHGRPIIFKMKKEELFGKFFR
jgi:DNA mismatch repair protein MutL